MATAEQRKKLLDYAAEIESKDNKKPTVINSILDTTTKPTPGKRLRKKLSKKGDGSLKEEIKGTVKEPTVTTFKNRGKNLRKKLKEYGI